jgi:lysophospholipase L1-like esterase
MHDVLMRWRQAPGTGVRLVAFGSSNTHETWHNQGRWSWFGWLAAAVRDQVGCHVATVNSGICGHTTADLLARFDRDVAPLRPGLVLVTIGGNDQRLLGRKEFTANLATLAARIRALGAEPVFQTYYCPTVEAPDLERFTAYMDLVVEAARDLGALVIDSLPAFSAWRRADPAAYQRIMHDPMHLNGLGHAIFGTVCCRGFGLADPPLPPDGADIAAGLTALSAASAPR